MLWNFQLCYQLTNIYSCLDADQVDDLIVGEIDEKKFRSSKEEEIDEALLEKLRDQLERANQTIVSMRNKERLLRIK